MVPIWRVHGNLGNGTFGTTDYGADIVFQESNSYNRPMAGDFNNDGYADIAYYGFCGSDSHACWRVHVNNGAGAFTVADYGASARFAGTDVTNTPVVGDFNGDDYDDIAYTGICGSDNHSCIRVHLNNQAGRFVANDYGGGIQLQGDDANNTPIAGDFNGDGYDDFAYLGACPGNCWRVHRNDGAGSFIPVDYGGSIRFRNNEINSTPVAADLNGDGYTDIAYSGVCGSNNHPCLRTHLNDRQRGFIVQDQGDVIAVEGVDAHNTPFAGDFDGDGTFGMGYFGLCGSSACWRMHQLQ